MSQQTALPTTSWCAHLPVLAGSTVTLREPGPPDLRAIQEVLSAIDATPFGLTDGVNDVAIGHLIERAARDRAARQSFTYAVVLASARSTVGLLQVRQLDPAFEGAEFECTLAPSARGTGVFLEAARLAVAFAFGSVGVRRLEARVMLENGRANGALRKLGAVQEGVLRRSARIGTTYCDQVLWSVLKEDWR